MTKSAPNWFTKGNEYTLFPLSFFAYCWRSRTSWQRSNVPIDEAALARYVGSQGDLDVHGDLILHGDGGVQQLVAHILHLVQLNKDKVIA